MANLASRSYIKTRLAKSGKAVAQKIDDYIIVKPKQDFWSLEGSLKSNIVLSDKELRKARDSFSKNWARND